MRARISHTGESHVLGAVAGRITEAESGSAGACRAGMEDDRRRAGTGRGKTGSTSCAANGKIRCVGAADGDAADRDRRGESVGQRDRLGWAVRAHRGAGERKAGGAGSNPAASQACKRDRLRAAAVGVIEIECGGARAGCSGAEEQVHGATRRRSQAGSAGLAEDRKVTRIGAGKCETADGDRARVSVRQGDDLLTALVADGHRCPAHACGRGSGIPCRRAARSRQCDRLRAIGCGIGKREGRSARACRGRREHNAGRTTGRSREGRSRSSCRKRRSRRSSHR